MSRDVRILRRAQADLLEIYAYHSRESPSAAARIIEELIAATERLGKLPESGPVARDDRLRRAGYRVLVQGRYLLFYKLVGAHVRIYRVLHQRRAYERLL